MKKNTRPLTTVHVMRARTESPHTKCLCVECNTTCYVYCICDVHQCDWCCWCFIVVVVVSIRCVFGAMHLSFSSMRQSTFEYSSLRVQVGCHTQFRHSVLIARYKETLLFFSCLSKSLSNKNLYRIDAILVVTFSYKINIVFLFFNKVKKSIE